MTVRFLLDSNIVSEPIRPAPSAQVVARLDAATGELALPSLVWNELKFGVSRLPASRRRDYLERYLSTVVEPAMQILPYDKAAAEWHARERARLEKRGKPPSFVDGQIAAIAVTQNLVLVTRNVRDFERFSDVQLENWFDPD